MTLFTIQTKIGEQTYYVRELTDNFGLFYMLTPVEYASTYFDSRISAADSLDWCERDFKGVEFKIKKEKLK